MTNRDPLIEEVRKKLKECLQTRLCKPIVPGWIAWVFLLGAFILSQRPASGFFVGNIEQSIIGGALTFTGFFLWDTNIVSRLCRVQRWKDAFKSFYHRYKGNKDQWFFIIAPIIFWWPSLPQLWRIIGMEFYLFVLYGSQELLKFSLGNPEIIRGLQASLLKPQLEVLRCAKEVVADYPPEAYKQLAKQIEIQLSAQEGLTWPWTIGIGIAADRLIDLLGNTPSAAFIVLFLALYILLRLTDSIYNYTALVQAIAQLEYESSLDPSKEDSSHAE